MPDSKSYFLQPAVCQAIIISIIMLIVAGGLYYFLQEEPPLPAKTVDVQPESEDKLIFSSGSLIEKREGKPVWELNSDSIETNLSTKKVRFSKVMGKFYDENENNGEISLMAENALLDTESRNIELNGTVEINGYKTTLTAPTARWDSVERKFLAEGGVAVTGEDIVLTGERIEASVDLENVVISGRAKLVKGGGVNEAP